jgi:aldose sugar dehydrogenase
VQHRFQGQTLETAMKCRPSSIATAFAAMISVAAACQGAPITDEQIRTEYQPIRVVKEVGGLEHPWSVAFLPDGRKLVTLRGGELLLVADGEATRVSGVPEVSARNQGGLLDVAVHPGYEENGWVYLTYSRGDADGTATALVRARLEDGALVDLEDLFEQDRRSRPGGHYGSRLAWTLDGKLLMSVGDRMMEPDRAQDLGDHAGSLLRLEDDGSVPEDNPFVGEEGAQHEIYSFGHRNIQGLIVHPESGEIWVTEHGPRGGDELNLIEAGGNYGWPEVSLGRDYRTFRPIGVRSKPGLIDPVIHWTPALAPSGLALVRGGRFPAWEGNLLAGGLRPEQIRRLVLEDGEVVHQEELLRGRIGRIRDVRVGPDGLIYVLTDQADGALYRIEPAG